MQIPYKHLDIPLDIAGFTVYDVSQEYVVAINKNLPTEIQESFYKDEVFKIESGFYTEDVIKYIF